MIKPYIVLAAPGLVVTYYLCVVCWWIAACLNAGAEIDRAGLDSRVRV